MRLKQRSGFLQVFFLLFLCFSLAACNDSDKPWSSIIETPEYKSLPDCAQKCVLDVTSVTNCTAYGCVCSDNTNGDNFLMGWTYISTCTTEGCQDQGSANEAVLAFRDICAEAYNDTSSVSITSTSHTTTTAPTVIPVLPTNGNEQPGGGGGGVNAPAITTTSSMSTPTSANTPEPTTIHLIKLASYPRLPPCSKFCLTSCRADTPSPKQEQDCFLIKKSSGWESYRGLAAQLNCESAQSPAACICAKNAFSISFNALYNQSAYFCNYLPTVRDYLSEDYNNLQGALADYCASNGYTPENYFLVVKGTAQPEGDGGGCLKDDPDALKPPDKIAIGIGLPTLLVAVCGLVLQIKQMRKGSQEESSNGSPPRGRLPSRGLFSRGSPSRSPSSEHRLTDMPRREPLGENQLEER